MNRDTIQISIVMYRIRNLFFLLSLSLFSPNIIAADWRYIVGNDSDDNFYVDINSIMVDDGNVLFWDLRDGPNPTSNKYYSSKNHIQADCKYKKFKVLAMYGYTGRMGKGSVTDLGTPGNEWVYAPPGRVYSVILESICN